MSAVKEPQKVRHESCNSKHVTTKTAVFAKLMKNRHGVRTCEPPPEAVYGACCALGNALCSWAERFKALQHKRDGALTSVGIDHLRSYQGSRRVWKMSAKSCKNVEGEQLLRESVFQACSEMQWSSCVANSE